MFTVLAKALAALAANRKIKAAEALAPYIRFAGPLVVGVIAFVLGYLHGDNLARAALIVVVLNEALFGFNVQVTVDSSTKS